MYQLIIYRNLQRSSKHDSSSRMPSQPPAAILKAHFCPNRALSATLGASEVTVTPVSVPFHPPAAGLRSILPRHVVLKSDHLVHMDG